jgi:hypothetical protein
MKNRYIVLAASTLLVGAGLFFNTGSDTITYQPRTQEVQENAVIDGYAEYMHLIKANPITGEVRAEDIQLARTQIDRVSKKHAKVNFPLEWDFAGPDNRGGRLRAFIIDRNDNKKFYAAGISGGLFQSENGGGTWYPINSEELNFCISSLCQTEAGTLVLGTGDGDFNGGGAGRESSAFRGVGMYRSTDGENFELIPGTANISAVYDLQVLKNGKDILAGTNQGLLLSTDEGQTWNNILFSSTKDIEIDANGNAIIYSGNTIYRSTNPSDGSSYVQAQGLPLSATRIALAVSSQDPNYVYAIYAGSITIAGQSYGSGMVGIYRSTDNGQNFTQIVGQGSQNFAPLCNLGTNSQGYYDLCIVVNPNDKDHIFFGGVRLAEWTKEGGELYLGSNFDAPTNPQGMHADKHNFIVDTKSDPPIIYTLTDGGIYKTTNQNFNRFKEINNGFSTTQFYGVSANINGVIMGGTQDNSNQLIDGLGSTDEASVEIWSGDGFQTEFSRINPSLCFGESQFGNLFRSFTLGTSPSRFFDNRISSEFASASQPNTIFNTPITLWEDVENQKGRLFYALSDAVWTAIDPHDQDKQTRWFKLGTISSAFTMDYTADGNHLFVGNRNGVVIRIDDINKVNFDTTEIVQYGAISDSLSQVRIDNGIPSRVITGISVDKNDPNRVVVTTGGYNNNNNVFLSEDALSDNPTWKEIGTFTQNSLPRMPVYAALINENNPDQIIIGTEFGIWATDNGSANNPTWTEQNGGVAGEEGVPDVPVFSLYQVSRWANTGPSIYAGTHGRGIFKTTSLTSGVKEVKSEGYDNLMSIYPMPARNSVNVKWTGEVVDQLEVYSLNGELVAEGEGQRLDVSSLPAGIYVIHATTTSGLKSAKRLLVQH